MEGLGGARGHGAERIQRHRRGVQAGGGGGPHSQRRAGGSAACHAPPRASEGQLVSEAVDWGGKRGGEGRGGEGRGMEPL